MVGMILGAAMRLVTGGSKVAMEHFQAKQRDVLEAKNHERQLQLMDREAAQAAQKQVIISESEVETAQLANTRAAIRDQGNLAGASQWIVDFCKFTRPGITWLNYGDGGNLSRVYARVAGLSGLRRGRFFGLPRADP